MDTNYHIETAYVIPGHECAYEISACLDDNTVRRVLNH